MKRLIVILLLSAIALVGCESKQQTGTLIGAGTGALLGSQFGQGQGQLLATGLGAVAGAYLGGQVGKTMDQQDRQRMNGALERQPDGFTKTWVNPNTQSQYTVTPMHTTESSDNRPCRDYVMDVKLADGSTESVHGRACRSPDGRWEQVS